MTSYECFKLAERIEVLAHDLYVTLAAHQSTPAGLRLVFSGLAEEEEHHGQRIQLLAASLRGSAWANQVASVAETGLQQVAAELETFLVEARTRRRPGDLVRILDRLVTMEERFAFVHAEELSKGAEPGVARLFASLAKQDQRHRKLLERARAGQASAPLGS
jgi:rubrerythrin